MRCNAPAADEVWGGNCLRNIGRLRADACLRGARLEDTWRVTIFLHTLRDLRPQDTTVMDSSPARLELAAALPSTQVRYV
jgi:hypothetical protein